MQDQNNNFYSVGNGGFTIRSRSLLEAPSKFSLEDNFENTNFHEDGFFSVYHRKFLESKGWTPELDTLRLYARNEDWDLSSKRTHS